MSGDRRCGNSPVCAVLVEEDREEGDHAWQQHHED